MTHEQRRAQSFPQKLAESLWTPVLIVLLGIAERGFLLWKYPTAWFCSDEANLGLMAIRLVRDGTVNVFIAGESYGGFSGVAVTALFSMVVGPFWGIKLTALFFFLLFAASLYALAFLVVGRKPAVIALSLVCLAPSFLATVGVRERGPHGEALFIGCALLLMTVIVSRAQTHVRLLLAAWGFTAGFAWYTYYLTVVFILPSAFFLAMLLGRNLSLRRLPTHLAVVLAGAFIGSAPYWFFALRHGFLPPFQDLGGPADPTAGFRNFFLTGLPVITGGRWPFHAEDLVPMFSKLTFYFYLTSALLWLGISTLRSDWRKGSRLLISMYLVSYPVIFAFSSFYWFAEEPRYLIGLYAALPITAAWLVERIAAASKSLSVAAFCLLPAVSLWGTFTMPSQAFSTIFDEPNHELIEYLKRNELQRFYANYWITYRVMFEAVEDVDKPFPLIGATYFSVVRPRFPEYEQAVERAPDPAFVAWRPEADAFQEKLERAGREFTKANIGRYVVFSRIRPPLTRDEIR